MSTANSFIAPGGGIRRRSNLGLISSSINPKKIYESWLMTLRIRTYFANLRVVQDPELLSQLSSRIEPSGKDSRTVQPAVVSSVGNAGTTTTNNNNSSTNEGNDPQQLYTSNLPSSNNNTKLKGIKLSLTKTSAQSVIVESNTNKKSPLKVINVSTESPYVPSATVAVSITSHPRSTDPKDMFTRPLLGAQSVEDARKLLALSVGSKRSSQRRLPVFTFPNHFHYNNTHNVAQSLFITSPVRPYAGIGFGHLKSQHYNNSNISSSIGSFYQVNNNTIIQMSNNSTPKLSSTSNATISTCSNHLHHHHHYSNTQLICPQPTRCYSTPTGTTGSKSLLLDNLIPIPSRIATNMNDSGNSNSTSDQMYAMLPNQRDPCHLHQHQHSLTHHQQASASPHNRGQATMKHQHFSQATNQNTNYQYQV
ncbi:unnamed protein product [Schistosoma mattheei]|uniref:Uncharacterized protein n=1 Tax=Schistosoma mattheei TaxID=31246 RepID=A0A3P8G463_9TREM|nr:unnamed protein product [Schistosoma mattheei]